MKHVITLVVLGILTMTGAVIEAFFQNLPASVVQLNGLLTIIFAMAFVIFTLKIQANGFKATE